MKRVILTGAAGFVGRHAIGPLLARGFEVDAVTSGAAPRAELPGVRWHRADLLDSDAARALATRLRATHLLHFAWYTEHGRFWDAPENAAWRHASLALVRAFREAGGERAVVAGTCAEYAPGDAPRSERSTGTGPAHRYGVEKLALHDAFFTYCDASGLSGAWGRIFFLYGPGERPERLVPSVARALLAGGRARCTEGRQVRDFLHVADVGDAFAALLDSAVEGAINVASGMPLTLRELVLAVAAHCDAADRVDFGAIAPPPGEPPSIVADVARLRDELRWRPRFDLVAGTADAVRWWREGAAR